MNKLILGSASPRRKEILSYFSLPFEQKSSDFDERSIPFLKNPEQYVADLSLAKLMELKEKFPDRLIITADTIVSLSDKVYNKPNNFDEAFEALSELQGKWHSVFTALSLYDGKKEIFKGIEETKVLFNPLTPDEIRHYLSKVHFTDRAGSYTIQAGAGLIVNKIDGCYYNVVGLPINTLRKLLQKIGIDLWEYVR